MTSIAERLREVFAAVLGTAPDALDDAASPQTIESWDSVHHIQLVMAIESEFDLEFDPDEIAALTSFGMFRRRVERAATGGA